MKTEERVLWGVVGITLAVSSIMIMAKGPVLGNDSYSYLDMSVFRPAGYALFLYCLRVFGESQLTATVVIQTLFNAVVIFYFLKYIQQRFGVNTKYLLLLLPLVVYFLIQKIEPENILTEAIAFPVFIIISIQIIEGILQNRLKNLLIASLLNIILVLVRGQFLLIFPFLFIVSLYLLYKRWNWEAVKKVALLGVFLVLSLLSTSLLNKTYHFIFHDTFADTQLNMSFVMNAMYISEKDDFKLFEDEQIQTIHREVYDTLFVQAYNKDGYTRKIQLTLNKEEQKRSELIHHYHQNLLSIGTTLDSDIIRSKFPGLNSEEYLIQRTELFKELASEIIYAHPVSYFYVNLADIFVYGFGNSRMYLLVFVMFYLISFLGSLKRNDLAGIFFLFQTVYLMNYVLIALSNRVLPRYTFYYEFILLTVLIISMVKILTSENRIEKEKHKVG